MLKTIDNTFIFIKEKHFLQNIYEIKIYCIFRSKVSMINEFLRHEKTSNSKSKIIINFLIQHLYNIIVSEPNCLIAYFRHFFQSFFEFPNCRNFLLAHFSPSPSTLPTLIQFIIQFYLAKKIYTSQRQVKKQKKINNIFFFKAVSYQDRFIDLLRGTFILFHTTFIILIHIIFNWTLWKETHIYKKNRNISNQNAYTEKENNAKYQTMGKKKLTKYTNSYRSVIIIMYWRRNKGAEHAPTDWGTSTCPLSYCY